MQAYTDESTAKEQLGKNVVFQVMINKYFLNEIGDRKIYLFPDLGDLGDAMSNYLYHQDDLYERGTLPPGLWITATVATDVGADTEAIEDSAPNNGIWNAAKNLLRGGCALCGVTVGPDGKDLKRCERCQAVRYCCRNHQRLHWKQGGHKEQCATS